jgi:hypothetical protein
MRLFADRVLSAISNLFSKRVRGFRVIEVGGFACLIALVLGVYLFKGMAGAEGSQIADTTRQIAVEQVRVRALKADLARLESPVRLERLSTQYLGLQPVSAKKETAPETLPVVVAQQTQAPNR